MKRVFLSSFRLSHFSARDIFRSIDNLSPPLLYPTTGYYSITTDFVPKEGEETNGCFFVHSAPGISTWRGQGRNNTPPVDFIFQPFLSFPLLALLHFKRGRSHLTKAEYRRHLPRSIINDEKIQRGGERRSLPFRFVRQLDPFYPASAGGGGDSLNAWMIAKKLPFKDTKLAKQ